MRRGSVIFMLRHFPTDSTFMVEYVRVNGRVVRKSQGFITGNVVDLNAYRRVKTAAAQQV